GALAPLVIAAVSGVLFMFLRNKIHKTICCAILAVSLVLGLSASAAYQDEHKYDWYTAFPVGRAWSALEKMTKGKSFRIASIGNERSYGLYGTGLRHDVFSVNVENHHDWQFHDYHRYAVEQKRAIQFYSERPQYHRFDASIDAWVSNLEKEKIELLFATTLDPVAMMHMEHDEKGFPIEVSWALSRPDLFKLVFSNSEVRIFYFNGTKH
ncbi:MAG TPA: hypothetical protein PLQ76_10080, partial [bacterium]|nr:hypothetical protein [bacterium]